MLILDIGKKYNFLEKGHNRNIFSLKVNKKTKYGYNVSLDDDFCRSRKLYIIEGNLYLDKHRLIHIMSSVEQEVYSKQLYLEYCYERIKLREENIKNFKNCIIERKNTITKIEENIKLIQDKILKTKQSLKSFNEDDVRLFNNIKNTLFKEEL